MRSPARQFVHCLIPACATPAVRGTRELSATPTNNVKSARASHGLKASFAATRYGKDERGHGASAMDFADSAAPHMLCVSSERGRRRYGLSWGTNRDTERGRFCKAALAVFQAWVYNGASSTRSEQKRRPRREGTTVPTPHYKILKRHRDWGSSETERRIGVGSGCVVRACVRGDKRVLVASRLKTHAQSKEAKATDTGPINSEVADRPVLGRVRTREGGEGARERRDLSDLDLTSRPRRSPRDGVQLGAEASGFFSGVCLEPQRRAYRNERTIHRVKGCVEAGEAGNRRVRSESWRAFWIGIKSSFSGAETEKEEEKVDQTQMTGLEE
ncbi:hypothetical protein EDB83DRAFT_2314806 [Lactarius deliciosus]|nr:hypothetical protein EDB83DRAFT_2314806 [Lactarius deliciosus]